MSRQKGCSTECCSELDQCLVKWCEHQNLVPIIYTTFFCYLLQWASECSFLMVPVNVGFLFISLTLLVSSSSSLKSVSHESLGGVLFPDTEDTFCMFQVWLTSLATSTADTLPCTTLEREFFFAAHVWQCAEGSHGPSKVASQRVWGNEESDSLIMNWWWLCLNQNSFLYSGSTKKCVCNRMTKYSHVAVCLCILLRLGIHILY